MTEFKDQDKKHFVMARDGTLIEVPEGYFERFALHRVPVVMTADPETNTVYFSPPKPCE